MSQRYTCTRFRHMMGKAAVKGRCYHGLSITRSIQDNQFCAVNPRFIAVVTECTGGGAFIVISVHQTGRVSPLHARVCGHRARVLDVKWDPFNDQRIASCSEDCTVKVWDIPQDGLKEDVTQPTKDLLAHDGRVVLIEWHPTARDVLLSSAHDLKVFVWRLDTATAAIHTPVCVINTHQKLVLCLTFNKDGSLLATACKDQKIRVIEPRTGRVLQESCSTSHRACKILFLWNLNMLLTTGNSCWNQRQFALWDLKDLSEPVLEEDLDGGSGVIFPFYDPDTHLLFLAGKIHRPAITADDKIQEEIMGVQGSSLQTNPFYPQCDLMLDITGFLHHSVLKGDGNIRYYEVNDMKPHIHFLAEYRSQFPQRGMGVMPKRGLNISACELIRFYRLVGIRDLVEPLSFYVPRKQSGVFHADIFPLTAANQPALSAHQWLMGLNKEPLLMSLKPKELQLRHITSHDDPICIRTAELRDVVTDTCEWTEDDTQSHNWISSHALADVSWTETAGTETKVSCQHWEEIQDLQEKLKQKDEKIQQLEVELRITRRHVTVSF